MKSPFRGGFSFWGRNPKSKKLVVTGFPTLVDSYPGSHIYIYIFRQKRKHIPTSNHPINHLFYPVLNNWIEFTPLGSLDLSAFRPRRVASRVALRVARHSNPHALRGRRPRCKGCRSAGTLKSGSSKKTADSRAASISGPVSCVFIHHPIKSHFPSVV